MSKIATSSEEEVVIADNSDHHHKGVHPTFSSPTIDNPPTLVTPSTEKDSNADVPPNQNDKTTDAGKAKTKNLIGWTAIGDAFEKYFFCHFTWVLPVLKNWSKMKPVIRSTLAAWLCMLCMIISPIEIALGSASFLILIGIFIAPCELPIVATMERELFILLLTCLSWAYANFAIFLADLARTNKVPQSEAQSNLIYSGGYIETAPTAICAVFLAIGSALALYLKVKFGPSPFIFATILSCIQLDITLVYAPLYPFPFYLLGQAIVIPLALKSAICIAVSCLVFPKSVNSAFIERLVAGLKPLGETPTMLLDQFKQSPTDPLFDFDKLSGLVSQAEANLIPMIGTARLITREVSFSLASGEDLRSLIELFRSMLAPADGIALYFTSVKSDISGLNFHVHPRTSQFATPIPTRPGTPTHSKPPTPGIDDIAEEPNKSKNQEECITASSTHFRQHLRPHLANVETGTSSPASSFHRRHSTELRHRMQSALHGWHWRRHHQEDPVDVGLWESLRYAAVESQLHNSHDDRHTEMCFDMLGQVSKDLLSQQAETLQTVQIWLLDLNKRRFKQLRKALLFMSTKNDVPPGMLENGNPIKTMAEVIIDLQKALDEFKIRKQTVLEPFRSSVDRREGDEDEERIPHRYLFQCFTFCYFQIQFTERLLSFIKRLDHIQKDRTQWKFRFPALPKLFTIEAWKSYGDRDDAHTEEHDEDPAEIPGMVSSLGKTKARDPEVMEGEGNGLLHSVGQVFTQFTSQILRGNSLFMIKVACVTVLVALPSFLRSSAGWAYDNKAIWTIIMAQLTFARHRGEVLFSLASRIIASFAGLIIGMLIWYTAAGNGVANPYAMAVVTAFGFFALMFLRLHLPGPPTTSLIMVITAALVVGYSWKDTHNPTYGSPGKGWSIAYHRFIEVVIGTLAAYIGAILPPSSSMRKYYRLSHATAITEIGGMYCQTVTLAVKPDQLETKQAIAHLSAIRYKVRRLGMLKLNIAYEFSLRGPWPMKRYNELEAVELQLSKLLTHAISIHENLGPTYSRALLRRCHFLDPLFLADTICILTMCATSLKTCQPLPQIVPVLIDRYLKYAPGFQYRSKKEFSSSNPNATFENAPISVLEDEEDEDKTLAQLSRIVTFDTLGTEEYQTFAVGVIVIYGIVRRLDRLCLAVKALVGESYSVPTDLNYSYGQD